MTNSSKLGLLRLGLGRLGWRGTATAAPFEMTVIDGEPLQLTARNISMEVTATKHPAIAQTISDAATLQVAVSETDTIDVETSDHGALHVTIEKAPA